jgi:hypothetical protein
VLFAGIFADGCVLFAGMLAEGWVLFAGIFAEGCVLPAGILAEGCVLFAGMFAVGVVELFAPALLVMPPLAVDEVPPVPAAALPPPEALAPDPPAPAPPAAPPPAPPPPPPPACAAKGAMAKANPNTNTRAVRDSRADKIEQYVFISSTRHATCQCPPMVAYLSNRAVCTREPGALCRILKCHAPQSADTLPQGKSHRAKRGGAGFCAAVRIHK